MKYVRIASASLAVAVTLSLLVSCGGKGGSESSGTTPPSTGDHTAVVGGDRHRALLGGRLCDG